MHGIIMKQRQKTKMENLQKKDILTDHLRGLSNARRRNTNNTRVSNQGMSESFFEFDI